MQFLATVALLATVVSSQNTGCAQNSVECRTNNCIPLSMLAAQPLVHEVGAARRRVLACDTGCVSPRIHATAAASPTTYLELAFDHPFQAYASVSSQYQVSFGICYAQNDGDFSATTPCNYRNVTVTLVDGDAVGRQRFVYSVNFWQLPSALDQLSAQVAALQNALPSNDTEAVGSLLYGLRHTRGGALVTLTSVSTGTPPAVSCTCTNGYGGADCSIPGARSRIPPVIIAGAVLGGVCVLVSLLYVFVFVSLCSEERGTARGKVSRFAVHL
jgi:hypothetical protein